MERYDSIQVLRAVAAGLVVFTHALMNYDNKISNFSDGINWGSDFGVMLFFCISGFIIYKSTVSLAPTVHSSIYFFIRRIIRIIPIYWIATTIYAAKLSFVDGIHIAPETLIYSFLFIPYVGTVMV